MLSSVQRVVEQRIYMWYIVRAVFWFWVELFYTNLIRQMIHGQAATVYSYDYILLAVIAWPGTTFWMIIIICNICSSSSSSSNKTKAGIIWWWRWNLSKNEGCGRIYPTLTAISPTPTLHLARFMASSLSKPISCSKK